VSALAGAEAAEVAADVPVPITIWPTPDVDGVDCTGCVSPCNACGTVDIDRACCAWEVAAVPPAWVIAAAWAASPAGLVVWGGGANGNSIDAAAELPA
jgi:hypothetical protein